MPQIDVDFDVWKALTIQRSKESETCNDVLRKLLKLPEAPPSSTTGAAPEAEGWRVKRVFFAEGTQFHAVYKGADYAGVVRNGRMVVGGKPYGFPSPAAVAVTGHNVNGWRFWRSRRPGDPDWRLMASVLRT